MDKLGHIFPVCFVSFWYGWKIPRKVLFEVLFIRLTWPFPLWVVWHSTWERSLPECWGLFGSNNVLHTLDVLIALLLRYFSNFNLTAIGVRRKKHSILSPSICSSVVIDVSQIASPLPRSRIAVIAASSSSCM